MNTVTKTQRGFELIEFKDCYDTPCSLQQSSVSYDDDLDRPGTSAVWLGTDDAMPKVMWRDAAAVGVETKATEGWVPYPIPEQVSLRTRMHLNREQVKELVAHLQAWLEEGSFEP